VPLDFADTVTYRGMMFSGVPNLVGSRLLRASWTLRVDLVSDFVNRMLLHMDDSERRGSRRDSPEDLEDQWLEWSTWSTHPTFDAFDALMPKRLDKPEWRHTRTTGRRDELPLVDLDEGCLVFE